MTFLLGLIPWWGWILIVLSGIGLAMFPVQAMAIVRRIPLKAWLCLGALLIVFLAYRVGYQVRGVECENANKAAQDAADKQAKAQEEAAPVIAADAAKAVQPTVETRVIYVNKNNTVSCDEPYSDELQQAIREAQAAADNVR